MNKLDITRIDVASVFVRDTVLSEFIGNTLRGALGESIIRRCCKTQSAICTDCRHSQDCALYRVYKTPDNMLGVAGATPNPYIINVPYTKKRDYKEGESISFAVLLVGNARRFEQDILAAIENMYCEKLSALRQVSAEKSSISWNDEGELDSVDSVKLQFLTPTHIPQVMAERDRTKFFYPFMDAMFARISLLLDLYGDADFILPYALLYRKPDVKAVCSFESAKIQQEEFNFSGIAGEVSFSGALTKYMPYISLGSIIHIGKMTTRGCGEFRYEIG